MVDSFNNTKYWEITKYSQELRIKMMQSGEIEFFFVVYLPYLTYRIMPDQFLVTQKYICTQKIKSSNFNAETRNENLQNEDVLHL